MALAEDLLSEMSFAEVIKMGAAAVAHSLGLREIKACNHCLVLALRGVSTQMLCPFCFETAIEPCCYAGVQLPEHIIREMQGAMDARRPPTGVARV